MTDDADAYSPDEQAEHWSARDAEEIQGLRLCPECGSTRLEYGDTAGPHGRRRRWTHCRACCTVFDVELVGP